MFPTSAIPGYPFGPQYFSTIIQVSSISSSGSSILLWYSSMLSNTTARPLCTIKSGEAADGLIMAPSGAKFPFNTAIPPFGLKGLLTE